MKHFKATGRAHVSYSGFVNHSSSDESLKTGLVEVFSSLKDVVVIDGDDDWYSAKITQPSIIAKHAKIEIIATFHSGISGMAHSGIVIKSKDLGKFKKAFKALSQDESQTRGSKPNYSAIERVSDLGVTIYKPNKTELLETKGTRWSMY